MSLKLPIYRRDVDDKIINQVEGTRLKNIDVHGHLGAGQEPANRASQPSLSSERHARFDLDLAGNMESVCCAQNTIHNVKHSSKLREKKVSSSNSIAKLEYALNQWSFYSYGTFLQVWKEDSVSKHRSSRLWPSREDSKKSTRRCSSECGMAEQSISCSYLWSLSKLTHTSRRSKSEMRSWRPSSSNA